jgi:putative RNA 2'-phosphotransferase
LDDTRASKFLSLVLRHQPEVLGLTLDPGGWIGVEVLLEALRSHGRPLLREDLRRIIDEDAKARYAWDVERDRVRAQQGHSVEVDLGLTRAEPPPLLFHGTPDRNVEAILRDGLRRGARHHVHLSVDRATAAQVGGRRGSYTVLVVDAGRMHWDGLVFYRSANGVWLTDAVPSRYLGTDPSPPLG